MTLHFPLKTISFIAVASVLLTMASCKKDNKSNINNNNNNNNNNGPATPKQIGLYEADSAIYKELAIAVSKIGTLTVDYGLVYDTGSGGMVIDAHGIIPSSMITSGGFNFTGDSTVVDGITITSQVDTIQYGDDANTTEKVYGNLAYAPVIIGDQGSTVTIKRLPFFLYYKALDNHGKLVSPHEFDVMGVSPQYDIVFRNGVYITSPFSYYEPGAGLTKGFKMAALGTNNFTLQPNFVPNVVTLGLTQSDISSAGFTLSPLTYISGNGYVPLQSGTIDYNGKHIAAEFIFDTGTEPYNYIEDRSASTTITLLPNSTPVAVTTSAGFKYDFTTTPNDYLTYVENPSVSKTTISVMSLEFFLNNEYMIDFADNKLGLKNQ
ncbi:MAG: hypothetical protein JST19_04915 [Bacteroidetes bacterium]|nr:hypothetical protein [Bacteroidota bacterium]